MCGDKILIKFDIKDIEKYVIDNIQVYYEKNDVFEKCYDILSKNQVELKEISSSKYQGKVNTEKEKTYIMFTIPYDEGWKIKVDGKEAETLEMQDALMGVLIDNSGEHEIEMKFVPKGIYLGAILSAFGILFLLYLKLCIDL